MNLVHIHVFVSSFQGICCTFHGGQDGRVRVGTLQGFSLHFNGGEGSVNLLKLFIVAFLPLESLKRGSFISFSILPRHGSLRFNFLFEKLLLLHQHFFGLPQILNGLARGRGLVGALPPSEHFPEKTIKTYNQKAIQTFNQKAIKSYNQKAIKAYNQKAIQAYNQKAIQTYNQKTIKTYNQKDNQKEP